MAVAIIGTYSASAQVTVNSSNGYKVAIEVIPVSIVTKGNNCKYGYNYNVKFNINIEITGKNKPEELYTLQGTLGCGKSKHFFKLPKKGNKEELTSKSNVWNSNSDCQTATLSSLFCDSIAIEIAGPGIPSQIVNFSSGFVALPVEVTQFQVSAVDSKIFVNWKTVSEINTDYFTVERSANGKDWKLVTTLKAAGHSDLVQTYVCEDANPMAGTVYYRLSETDLNGNTRIHAMRAVKCKASANITAWPLPNQGNILNFSGINEVENFSVQIADINGKIVSKTALDANGSSTINYLAPGIFYLNVVNTTTNESIYKMQYVQL